MPENFSYDVFLSYSSKDRLRVHRLADRLKNSGLRVWIDVWEIKPGDNIPTKIEEGMEQSRVLALCMSGHAFGSDWTQLEAGTFRFRDPLNKERRFLPVRLDHTPIKGSLIQFLYVDWTEEEELEYQKLLDACRPRNTPAISNRNSQQIMMRSVVSPNAPMLGTPQIGSLIDGDILLQSLRIIGAHLLKQSSQRDGMHELASIIRTASISDTVAQQIIKQLVFEKYLQPVSGKRYELTLRARTFLSK